LKNKKKINFGTTIGKDCQKEILQYFIYLLMKLLEKKGQIGRGTDGNEDEKKENINMLCMYPFSSCSSQLYKSLFVIVSRDSIHPAMRMR
jgi:hypothetical protein